MLVEVDQLDTVVGGLLGGHERVDRQDRHLHRQGPGGDRLADLAQADDPERPAAQLEARELRLASIRRAGARRRPAAVRRASAVQQRERVLGRRDRVAGRRVDDHDPGPRRRVEVDVVDADAGPADDHQPRPGGDQAGIDLDLAADDQGVVVGQDRAQLVARQARPLVDLVARPQQRHALGGDRFGDEDLHAPAPAAAGRRQAERLERGDLGRGDRGARADRPAEPDRRELEDAHRAQDLLDRHRPEVAEPEDLAGQLALTAGEDQPAPLELGVERLPVEVVGDAGRR